MATKRNPPHRLRCTHCGGRFSRPRRGRPPKYCSHSCRQRAYEARVVEREVSARLPARLLEGDLGGKRSRDAHKRLIISVLQEVGLLPGAPPPGRSRPGLRLVKDESDTSDHDLA